MNHVIYYQRMSPGKGASFTPGGGDPGPTVSVIDINSNIASVSEGDSIQYNVNRTGNLNTNCSVDWKVTSAAGTADFTGATSGTVSFTPTGGQTQVISVNTTNRTGLQGDRDVTATLSNPIGCEINSSSSARSVLVDDAEPEPPPPPPGTGPVNNFAPSAPPNVSAANTLRVPEDYTLNQAIAAVQPGQQISVADGHKIPAITISRVMDENNWTVLRSRNVGKAILEGMLILSAKGWWIHGFKSTFLSRTNKDEDQFSIRIQANYLVITRNSFRNAGTCVGCNISATHHIWIGWNTFDQIDQGGQALWVTIPGAGNFSNANQGPNNWDVYRNDFFDSAPREGNPDDHVVYLGESHPEDNDVLSLTNWNFRQNLIRPASNRKRGMYIKRGCYIVQNTLSGNSYNCGYRHGGQNIMESNIVENSSICSMSGPYYKMYNNLFQGGTKLVVNSGNGANATGYAGPPYQAADYAELDGNTGPVVIGYKAGKTLNSTLGGKCDHVTVYKHNTNAQISFVSGYYDEGTYRNTGNPKGLTYLPRFRLTTTDVGQFGS